MSEPSLEKVVEEARAKGWAEGVGCGMSAVAVAIAVVFAFLWILDHIQIVVN